MRVIGSQQRVVHVFTIPFPALGKPPQEPPACALRVEARHVLHKGFQQVVERLRGEDVGVYGIDFEHGKHRPHRELPVCAMLREDIICDLHALRALLSNDFAPYFDPLKSYLDSLSVWDGVTDYIGTLAAMVHCKCCDTETFADVERPNRRNRRFEESNIARDLIQAYFRRPAAGEAGKYMNVGQLMARFGGSVRLNNNQLTKVLSTMGFDRVHTRNGRFWIMVERGQQEVSQILPEPAEEILPGVNPSAMDGGMADDGDEPPEMSIPVKKNDD